MCVSRIPRNGFAEGSQSGLNVSALNPSGLTNRDCDSELFHLLCHLVARLQRVRHVEGQEGPSHRTGDHAIHVVIDHTVQRHIAVFDNDMNRRIGSKSITGQDRMRIDGTRDQVSRVCYYRGPGSPATSTRVRHRLAAALRRGRRDGPGAATRVHTSRNSLNKREP